MKVLDCESIESTYKSLETILGVNERELQGLFDSADPHEAWQRDCESFKSPGGFLLSHLQQKTGCESDFDATCWFHCTRTLRGNAFDEGILPLYQVLPKIWNLLFELSKRELTTKQFQFLRATIPFGADTYQARFMRPDIGGGPDALLIKEAALEAAKSHTYWNYFEIPEVVHDICEHCKHKYGVDLKTKFIANTVPCIVKFIDYTSNTNVLGGAMIYAYHAHRNLDLLPACNFCLPGKGIPITEDRILKVDFLSESKIETV